MSDMTFESTAARHAEFQRNQRPMPVLPDLREQAQTSVRSESQTTAVQRMSAAQAVTAHQPDIRQKARVLPDFRNAAESACQQLVQRVSQSAEVLPAAENQTALVQRAKIWENIDSYLDGNAANRNDIRAYFYKYEIPHMVNLAEGYTMDDKKKGKVQRAYALYQQSFQAAVASVQPDWNKVAGILRGLVTNINDALADAPGAPAGYEAGDAGNWANAEAAVTAAHGAINGNIAGIAPASHSAVARQIRTIDYSTATGIFPSTLVRLLRDIHAAWRTGQIMDERSREDQQNRTLNADEPGALRSWHMNTSQTLPAAPGGPTPQNATAMETHYTDTSGVMNILGAAAGPVGFAEYTGTGILDDAHNSKIVLDYRQGNVYLTLTHYQHWSPTPQGGAQIQGQDVGSGQHSPWFKIDMNA